MEGQSSTWMVRSLITLSQDPGIRSFETRSWMAGLSTFRGGMTGYYTPQALNLEATYMEAMVAAVNILLRAQKKNPILKAIA